MVSIPRIAPLLALTLSGCVTASADGPHEATGTQARAVGDWLGATQPGATPAVFAPGIVSTDLFERDTAWSPDGRTLYYSVQGAGDHVVRVRRLDDGSWSEPELAPFAGGQSSLEPFVTPDGAWMYFASRRPLPGETEPGDWNLWRAPRAEDGYGPPEPLPEAINGPGDEFFPSLTRDGTLYFTAQLEGGLGGEDLYRARAQNGGFAAPENLGPQVNGPGPEFNALVHPDGAWILFGSARPGDLGGGDLYVSFGTPSGEWTAAKPLPAPLNSDALDYSPGLSPDGRWLFFTSRRLVDPPASPDSFRDLAGRLRSADNGLGNLWWVEASVLDGLRPPAGERN